MGNSESSEDERRRLLRPERLVESEMLPGWPRMMITESWEWPEEERRRRPRESFPWIDELREKKMKDYQEALKLGKVLVAYARVMMVGPGGVGKSSFLRGLMNQRLPQDAESTILVDTKTVKPQFWVKAGESADSYWAEVSDQDEIEELAGLFQLVLAKLHPSKAAAVGESNPQEDEPQSAETISDESVSDIKDTEVQKVLQQVAEHDLHHSQNPAAPQSEVLMHVWDCGGQAVFLDFLPAFLTSRTMFLLFFDARQNLDEKCKTLSHKAGRVVSKSKESFTTLQLLSQWMASIHAMCIRKDTFTAPSGSENPATQGNEAHVSFDGQESLTTSVGEDINPKIIPVGTHGDAVRNGRKQDKILSTLRSHCKSKAYTPLLLDGVIVDNTTAGFDREGEDKGFNYIRKRVHQFASKDLAVRTPVTWVLFRKVLQNVAKDNPIVPYERAVAVGQACRIAEDVVRSVLHFYHELAVFLHYTQIENFSDKVIVDPQWLVKQLGKLLAPEELKQKVSNRSLLDPLHENGILVQRLYEEVWEESNSKYKIPQKSLVDLLNHFLLAAPLDPIDPDKLPKSVIPYQDQKKYFIPSVLKLSSTHLATTLHKYCIPCVSQNNDSATQPVKMSSPLHLTFSTQYVPPGFFTRLATTLTRKPNCQPLFERGVYRNKITFAYDQIDEFTICEQSSSVQISVVRIRHRQSREMTFGNTCCAVKELILACSAIVKEWLPSVEVKAAFLCEQCPNFITILHGVNTGSNLRCKAGHSCNLTKEKQYWLKIPCIPECFAQKGDLNDAELQGVAHDVQKYGKLKELADELEMPLYGVNAPITLLSRWRSEIENGSEAHSLLVHHLKCIELTGTSDSLYYRQFLSPSRTNPIAENKGAARDRGREIVDSVDNTSRTTREPLNHQLSHQHTHPRVYRQKTFTGVAAPGMRPPSAASTGARSQQHSSTITGGYVQQVPYPKDDAQTWHSQLGHVPPHSYHHYRENSNQLPTGPTHQPTYHQPSHSGYPPPGHQYPPQHVPHYGHPPPNSSHHTSFPSHQYTGPRVQGSTKELNVKNIVNVLHEAKFSDADWELLGLQLIKHTDLTTIEAKRHGKPGLCMMDMVSQWLKTESQPSWDKLAEAVEKVEGYGEATAKVVWRGAEIDS